MRSNRSLEIGTGLFVLLGFAALFFLTTQLPSSGLKLTGNKAGFRVTAEFDNVGDLKSGAPVTMAGVNIGDVQSIRIDPKSFRALVTMRIDPQYTQIPDDSDASINTQGLLGGQYIAIGPGGSDTYLKGGSQIQFTQSAIVLENLVNKMFANFASGNSSSGGSDKSSGTNHAGSGGSGDQSGTSNAGSNASNAAPPSGSNPAPRNGRKKESSK